MPTPSRPSGVSANTDAVHQPRVVLSVDVEPDLILETEPSPEIRPVHDRLGAGVAKSRRAKRAYCTYEVSILQQQDRES